MMPVKGRVSIEDMHNIKSDVRDSVGSQDWRFLLDELWNYIEEHLGLEYMTPWTNHEGRGEDDWIGSMR